jgi:hypothetical protein
VRDAGHQFDGRSLLWPSGWVAFDIRRVAIVRRVGLAVLVGGASKADLFEREWIERRVDSSAASGVDPLTPPVVVLTVV